MLINNLKSENNRLKTDIELCHKTEERTDGKLSEEGTQELLELLFKLEGMMGVDYLEKNKLTIPKSNFRVAIDAIKKAIGNYGSYCP